MLWILAALSIAQADTPAPILPAGDSRAPQVRHLDKDEAAKHALLQGQTEPLKRGEIRFDLNKGRVDVGVIDQGFGRAVAGKGLELSWSFDLRKKRKDRRNPPTEDQ
jgi:hypothetical protein